MSNTNQSLDQLCVNTIRTLAIDAIQKANSGHPGLPLGAAPMAYVLWQRHLRHDPGEAAWLDRDRFILSAGHGSMLQYALLHLTGHDLSMQDLQDFRQWGSRTPGHPEYGETAGVEATTGPLGQGTANAVGMAIAERALAHRYNTADHTVIDHFTYALVSDGDLMEGLAAEAASLAGHLKLGKLIYLYDANDISLDGPLSLSFSEDVGKRYEAQGWHVQTVTDGDHDLDAIDRAIAAAQAEGECPSLIIVKTTIGFGSPNKGGSASCHGSPLGPDEVALTKQSLGFDPEQSFVVSDRAAAHFAEGRARGEAAHADWKERHAAWAAAHPDLAADLDRTIRGDLPSDWDASMPAFEVGTRVATRAAAGKALNAIGPKVPELIGTDADLSCSTKGHLNEMGSFEGQGGSGRNVHMGVREHAMASAVNGMLLHGGVRAFTSTFFCFSDYMRPAIRLAALSKLPAVYVWTHDSIGVGEDGPTHQPVEQLMSLRTMPDLYMIRPCDAAEANEAWRQALQRKGGPTGLVLSRQGLPVLDREVLAPASGLAKGAYVLSEADGAVQAILLATGSEVSIALEAQQELASDGIAARVVSMPCWELFETQDESYRESVLPPSVRARVSIEAGCTLGWHRWIGEAGTALGIDRFGASAPGNVNYEKFGMNAAAVCAAVRTLVANAHTAP